MMLQRMAIVAILWSIGAWGQAQVVTFNKVHHNVASGFAAGVAVRETPNGYIVFGMQTKLDTTSQDATVTTFNALGEFEQEYFTQWPGKQFLGATDPVGNIQEEQGFIAAITSRQTLAGSNHRIYAVRFDAFGDTLWTKLLLDEPFVAGRDAVSKGEHFYFAGPRMEALGEPIHGFLLRTDTMANSELYTFFTAPNNETLPMTVDVDEQGNIYVAGQHLAVPKGTLLKLDTAGQQLWTRYPPKPVSSWHNVKHMFSDRVLCMGMWSNSVQSPEYRIHMYLAMYDEDGNMLWDFDGLQAMQGGDHAHFTDAYQDSDSSFIACGAIQQAGWNRGLVYRFTKEGTVLWRRSYAHYGNIYYGAYLPEVPRDIEPTSDGGMILTGETWHMDTVPPLSNQSMWLLKLDGMGCLVPGCQYVGVNEQIYGLQGTLQAWPNPSSGPVTLELALPDGLPLEGTLTLQVFDALGRKVLTRVLPLQHRQRLQLDLGSQPRGVYSAHLSDGERILTSVKLQLQ